MTDDRIEVTLHGHVFRLRAPLEEHECLKKAAAHVNTIMEQLRTAGSGPAVVDTATLALQAAFRISHEYYKMMSGERPVPVAPSLQKQVGDRLQVVNDQLDELLRATVAPAPRMVKPVAAPEYTMQSSAPVEQSVSSADASPFSFDNNNEQ